MRPPPTAPASYKQRYPELFQPVSGWALNATCDFTEEEREHGELQWAYSAKKDMSAKSSVLVAIGPGKAHSHLIAQYQVALAGKIARKEAEAEDRKRKKADKAAAPPAKPKPKISGQTATKKRKTVAPTSSVNFEAAPIPPSTPATSNEVSGGGGFGKRKRTPKVFFE
jgi:hypothetical protein